MPASRVSLNIKNPDVHRLATRLAKLRHTTLTGAVLQALKQEVERAERHTRSGDEIDRMAAYSRRISALPVLDSRNEDEILGYTPAGYPDGD